MLAKFNAKKQSILDALRKPAEDYTDLSPKGSLDQEIRDLVEEINRLPDYVTTSSCAGRVAVYLDGGTKAQASAAPEGESASASGGGKGGGRWLFISHEPIDKDSLSALGAVYGKFGFSRKAEIAFPPPETAVRFVHLKFEPMILHALAGSAESAQTMLGAGMAAGFRESGISGIVDSKGRPQIPMVAIRSSGLAMDCIIGFQSTSSSQQVLPMVSEDYLRAMITVVNDRFQQNVQRKERFRTGLLMQLAGSIDPADDARSEYRRRGGFQTAAERKAEKRAEDMRKREEALERRAQALHRGGALDGAAEDGNHGDDLALDPLMIDEEDRHQ